MRNLLEKVNETVLELWTGILIWGAACQLIPVWFIKDKGGYSLGLWIGVILASAAAFHMWWSLDRGLDREGAAQGFIRKHAFIRYAVIVGVFAAVMLTRAANPLAAFLGIMGLKAAAYMQPFIHKRRHPETEGQADDALPSSPPDLSLCGGAQTGTENEEKKEVNLG